jgi:hypothetical protein
VLIFISSPSPFPRVPQHYGPVVRSDPFRPRSRHPRHRAPGYSQKRTLIDWLAVASSDPCSDQR